MYGSIASKSWVYCVVMQVMTSTVLGLREQESIYRVSHSPYKSKTHEKVVET